MSANEADRLADELTAMMEDAIDWSRAHLYGAAVHIEAVADDPKTSKEWKVQLTSMVIRLREIAEQVPYWKEAIENPGAEKRF
jgi:hypothetical protein